MVGRMNGRKKRIGETRMVERMNGRKKKDRGDEDGGKNEWMEEKIGYRFTDMDEPRTKK